MSQLDHFGIQSHGGVVTNINKNSRREILLKVEDSALIKLLVCMIAVWVPIQNSLTRAYPILPEYLVWLDEVLVISLIGVRLLRIGLYKAPFLLRLGISEILLLLFIFDGLASTWLNQVPALNAIMGYRSLLQYVPIYYILSTEYIPRRFAYFFVRLCLGMGLLQIPVVLLQIAMSIMAIGVVGDDVAFGTFTMTQANSLGYFIGMLMFVGIGIGHHFPERKRWIGLILVALTIAFLASSSRAMLFLLPVIVVWIERKGLFSISRHALYLYLHRLLIMLSSVLTLFILFLAYLYVRGYDYSRISPLSLFKDTIQINPWGDGGRLLHLSYTYETLATLPYGVWLGMGPGMYVSGAGWYLQSPGMIAINNYFGSQLYGSSYYERIWLPEFEEEFYVRGFSQLTSTFGEWGGVGIVLYILLLMTLYLKGVRVSAEAMHTPLLRALGIGVQGIAMLCLLSVPIIPIWEEQPLAFLLWALSGLMVGLYRTELYKGKPK